MTQKPQKKMTCCENCQIYWTCETKWYRGEKNQENVCCNRCNYYIECLNKTDERPFGK